MRNKKNSGALKGLVGILVTVAFSSMFATGYLVKTIHRKHYYPQTMYVYQVDTIHDVITFIDGNHELWQLEGVGDWDVGDCASLIMFDHYTPEIKDDEIVVARYNGFATCGELPLE